MTSNRYDEIAIPLQKMRRGVEEDDQQFGQTERNTRTFGRRVRELRLEKGLSLRKLAGELGLSPTYLSKIEREQLPPPASDKITAIAQVFGEDEDEFLGLAGRIAPDLTGIILLHPVEYAKLVRSLRTATRSRIRALIEFIETD